MPDYCEECFCAKEALCPECQEEFICGDCEQTCLRCYLSPDDADELQAQDFQGEGE